MTALILTAVCIKETEEVPICTTAQQALFSSTWTLLSKSVIYQPLGIFKKFPEKPFKSNSKPVNTIKKLK